LDGLGLETAKSKMQQLSEGLAGRLDAVIFNLESLGSKLRQIEDLTSISKAWLVGWML
jgi:hypothetical protein